VKFQNKTSCQVSLKEKSRSEVSRGVRPLVAATPLLAATRAEAVTSCAPSGC